MQNQEPKYRKIALDIAYSIINEELQEGSMVKGRSTLAGKYNVSPETIRRAVSLLSDAGVVEISEKSGIHIKSKDNANTFVQNSNVRSDIFRFKKEIEDLIIKKEGIESEIKDKMNSIIEYSTQFKNIGLINPIKIEIPLNSHIIGKTIGETRFWDNTGATIIGVNRNEYIYLSPGPSFIFNERDVIIFVGKDKKTVDNVKEYIES